jgi:hypothetical protein
MSTTSSASFGKAKHSPPAIAWRVWPIRDEGRRAWLLAASVPLVGLMTFIATGRWYLALVAALLTAAALWRLWVPVGYELQPKGLLQTILGRTWLIPWKDVRRCELQSEGVVLFASAQAVPWDMLRGLYVPCGPRREEMLVVLAYYLKGLAPTKDAPSTPSRVVS